MEKYRDGQKELHCEFVDLEKAYDRVPREELWYCMRKSGVAEKYVRVVQDMYERSRTVVRCAVGQTEEFNVEVGLHQGSALSPFLFAIVMDQLSEEVRQESPWTMMFADDIVICSESREQVEENLERWRFALERRGMKVSRSKTEYMCVNEREGSGTVRLQGEEVKKVQEFKYLGSTVQSNGECGKEVKKRVQAGWNGWRKVSGVLCDQKISARIKGKVYRTVVRPAMLYGLETVSLRKRQESELEVAELKMLRLRPRSCHTWQMLLKLVGMEERLLILRVTENGGMLKKIYVWEGDITLKAIKVWQTDGQSKQYGRPGGGDLKEFTFEDGEHFTSLSLWANKDGTRLGAIKFKTSHSREFYAKLRYWRLKPEVPVDVASGICMGIKGRSGWDIDRLGFIFINTVKSAELTNVMYPNIHEVIPKVAIGEIKSMSYQNNTSETQEYTIETSKKITQTSSWSVTGKLELTYTLKVNAGIPLLVEGKSRKLSDHSGRPRLDWKDFQTPSSKVPPPVTCPLTQQAIIQFQPPHARKEFQQKRADGSNIRLKLSIGFISSCS
ncbi:hypothetical protein QTP86_005102 [Hemibagrus guttatus]|nr:hypothetical protein QTP86_005102 [Hemibagrus guttatus]